MIHHRRFKLQIICILGILLAVCFAAYFFIVIQQSSNISQSLNTPVIRKSIVFWTKVFGQESGTLSDCPLNDRCTMTFDRSQVNDADAIVFHMTRNDFSWTDIPKYRHINQRYVFLSQETPLNSYIDTLNHIPGFFNWTMTYRLDSNIPMPYGGWWIRPDQILQVDASSLAHLNLSFNADNLIASKTKGSRILWIASNCVTVSKRELIIDALSKYLDIDIVGDCAHNQSSICPKPSPCDHLLKNYRFYIAMENTVCMDYITEKYWSHIDSMSIPIVERRYIYEHRLPNHSFIAIDDYANPIQLANYLKKLATDTDEYLEYFSWRYDGYDRHGWNSNGFRLGYCRLCQQLLETDRNNVSIINDMYKWFVIDAKCEHDQFAVNWSIGYNY